MFFIFGWGHQSIKNLGESLAQECPICSHVSHLSLIKTSNWFTLFLIPIFPYETKHYLECPNCKNALEIKDEENIRILEEIIELLKEFSDKEITKKKMNSKYDKLITGLKKEKEGKE